MNLLDFPWLNGFLYFWVLKWKISPMWFLIPWFLLACVDCIWILGFKGGPKPQKGFAPGNDKCINLHYVKLLLS